MLTIRLATDNEDHRWLVVVMTSMYSSFGNIMPHTLTRLCGSTKGFISLFSRHVIAISRLAALSGLCGLLHNVTGRVYVRDLKETKTK